MNAAHTAQTETDKAYAELHRAIVRGELLPNQHLVELKLAEQLGVGRAAVRTALDRLVQDGLVEHEPNRGAWVRLISLEEAVEMFEVRAVLEGLALRHTAHKATTQEIAELQTMVERMEERFVAGDLLAITDLNAGFHATLLRIAGHPTVTRLLERLQPTHVHFQYRMILVPERTRQSLQEHRAIVEAVAAHDADAAEAAMRQHLEHSARALQQSSKMVIPWPAAS